MVYFEAAVRRGRKSSVEKGQGMRAEGEGGSKTLETAQGTQLGAGKRHSKRNKEGTDLKKLFRRLLLLFFKRVIKKPIDSMLPARAIQSRFTFSGQGMTAQQFSTPASQTGHQALVTVT